MVSSLLPPARGAFQSFGTKHWVTHPKLRSQKSRESLARDPMSDVEDGEVEETEVVESEGGPCV